MSNFGTKAVEEWHKPDATARGADSGGKDVSGKLLNSDNGQ